MLINLISQGPSQASMPVLVSDNEGLWQASARRHYIYVEQFKNLMPI